jgi:hypothetical protein
MSKVMGKSDAELQEWADANSEAELSYFLTDAYEQRLKAIDKANHKDFIKRRRPIYVAAQARKRLGVE